MLGPERIPPTEVVEKKGTKERFATILTYLPGVSLRVEPGVEIDPDTLKKPIRTLYSLAKSYASRYLREKKLQSQQKKSGEEIKTLAQTHNGLRGVQSEEDNFVLSVFPRESISYDPKFLEESTGIAFSTIAHKDLVVAISIPVGFQTNRGPIGEEILKQVLSEALTGLGLPEDDLAKVMVTGVRIRVDEKRLEEMVKNGQVTLLEGTKQVDRTWAITVVPLKKS